MAVLFRPWTNTAVKLGAISLSCLGAAALIGPMVCVRTPYVTTRYDAPEQPVEFDHRHHVLDDRIDCQYCHREASRSTVAGIPGADVCMGCHAQIWRESPKLQPVVDSYFTGEPIAYVRVHDLPDHVYFDHSAHFEANIPCSRCHGPVASMARVYQWAPLTMGWCLDCHREPPPTTTRTHGRMTRLTTCTACHR